MKIAFLCRDYETVSRGAETYSGELTKQLKILGHNVKIYKSIFDHVDSDSKIVITTNGRLDAIFTKIWCMLYWVKLIIPGQSGFGWDDKLNLWLFPDVFVALTEYQKQWAQKINPFAKIVKIPNGVDLQKFNPKNKPLTIDKPKPVILCVGAVKTSKIGEISKRQKLLVKAGRKNGASILLVGPGGDMEVKHNDMPGVYTACDLFSYPTSQRESFGIAMLEAMASGLAVVATDDPIRREIVGDAGLFVDPNNTDEYARKLKEALDINWGDKPRKRAEKFSWGKIAKDYEKLFS